MKVLVIGGAGYIGSHTSHRLIDQGHEVVVYDNLSTGFNWAVPSSAQFIQGDILDSKFLSRVIKENHCESVIHFAANTLPTESIENPLKYYRNNVSGMISVLEACAETKIKNFIFSSTAAVYGNTAKTPIKETESTLPVNPYGQTKLMCEKILHDYAMASGMKYIVLRYFNVAGGRLDVKIGQSTKNAVQLIKICCEAACGKRPRITITGTDYPTKDGTGIRDYIHVEDLSEAHISALKFLYQGGGSQILNCGYGHGYSVREVVEMVKKVSLATFDVVEGPRRPGDIIESIADSSNLKRLLNWNPEYDSLELICKTQYQWEKLQSEKKLS